MLRDRVAGLSKVQIEISEHTRPPVKLGQVGLTAKSVIVVGSGKDRIELLNFGSFVVTPIQYHT